MKETLLFFVLEYMFGLPSLDLARTLLRESTAAFFLLLLLLLLLLLFLPVAFV